MDGWITKLRRPVDASGLAVFRILFGLVTLISSVRFLANGWVEMFLVKPTFFFKYWGFSWVEVWPAWGLYLHFSLLAVLSALITLGLFYRAATILYFIGFTYAELMDVTYYLNHYYLVSLLAFLLIFAPAHRALSLDALRKPSIASPTIAAGWMTLLRFQVGTVYVFAGLAKVGTDWLFYAQPLNIWLSARTDAALIGPLFDEPIVAYVMSWAGFVFDTTIVGWMSWSRTRPYAYAVIVVFHCLTYALFRIGMFPFIMIVGAMLFFPPDFPRRLLPKRLLREEARPDEATEGSPKLSPWVWTPPRAVAAACVMAYVVVQVAMPLRHLAYPSQTNWSEQGMRWAWKVMVREKNGSVTYRVRLPDAGKTVLVWPRKYLTSYQEREMSSQPDLILQLAHHVAGDFAKRGFGQVEVFADVVVSLNGRRPRRMIDPNVDLAKVEDGIGVARWILEGPTEPPIQLKSPRAPRGAEGRWRGSAAARPLRK